MRQSQRATTCRAPKSNCTLRPEGRTCREELSARGHELTLLVRASWWQTRLFALSLATSVASSDGKLPHTSKGAMRRCQTPATNEMKRLSEVAVLVRESRPMRSQYEHPARSSKARRDHDHEPLTGTRLPPIGIRRRRCSRARCASKFNLPPRSALESIGLEGEKCCAKRRAQYCASHSSRWSARVAGVTSI